MRALAAAIAILLISLPARAEVASFYGWESGRHTASGERFDPNGMTAASRTLAFGTWVRVTMGSRSVTVRISDRGPYHRNRAGQYDRDIDLSVGAASRIGCPGVCQVSLEVVGKPFSPQRGGGWF